MKPITLVLASLLTIGSGTTAQPLPGNLQLPEIGDTAGRNLSPHDERTLGEAFMRQLRRHVTLTSDPELNTYLHQLGRNLVAGLDNPTQPFHFFLVEDDSINAFAAPGGYIGIHSGLFLAARNESELAGVVAHEIAHVTQRHLARAYEEAGKMSLPTAAAVLASILLATRNAEMGQAALLSVQAGTIQQQINFTRDNEKEADRVGMITLARSGYDPYGMPSFFERLHQHTRLYGERPPEFLSTHPVTTNRIAESADRAAQLGRQSPADETSFRLAQRKLRNLITKDKASLLGSYQNPPEGQSKSDPLFAYGHGLALLANRRAEEAVPIFEDLVRRDQNRIAYRVALAQAQQESGALQSAGRTFEEALRDYPGNYTLSFHYARFLLANAQPAQAQRLFEQLTHQHRDPELFRQLAIAAGANNKRADALEAMSEHYFLIGDTGSALQQLELARDVPELSFFQASRIDARLRELRGMLRQERS